MYEPDEDGGDTVDVPDTPVYRHLMESRMR